MNQLNTNVTFMELIQLSSKLKVNYGNGSRIVGTFNDHRVINDFDGMLEIVLPRGKEILHQTDDDSFYLRFYLTMYALLQLACCIILFLLNNWHYILIWFNKIDQNRFIENENGRKLKHTLSVNNFLRKLEYEKAKMSYLNELIDKHDKTSTNTIHNEVDSNLLGENELANKEINFSLYKPESYLNLISINEQEESISVSLYRSSFKSKLR